ncbi:MAG: squalene--hopene cyclase [Burkholderiales bacterium]
MVHPAGRLHRKLSVVRDAPRNALDHAIDRAREALLAAQHPEGYWCFELEADCTIPAEYVLMMHYMDEIDEALQEKFAVYLRARQMAHGGWPLYHGGAFDISCSVKVYYALKLAGDCTEAPHMVKARQAILAHGGGARANVFTRITLALFGQVPWRAVPFIPVEVMLLPRWFPFHVSRVSYWSRAVMVPLFILCSLKPKARNPKQVDIRELFTIEPEHEQHYFPSRSRLNDLFLLLDRIGRRLEPLIPGWVRRRAVRKAEAWFLERLNGLGGLGAIFPAMVNAYEALDLLGFPPDHPHRRTAKEALERLLVIGEHRAYCQPCFPPVWDTGIACLALTESGGADQSVSRGLDWLKANQLLDEPGDWRESRPRLRGGGWPFQFENGHYPDIDDTSMVAWAMEAVGNAAYAESIARAIEWIRGMQSENGGFGAFDVDNTHYYLNEIPFADHGALLDPPTADVSARCVAVLAFTARTNPDHQAALEACMGYLRAEQEPSGAWFGRWGTNYIYGTWSVLAAFEVAGIPHSDPAVQRAAAWLKSVQRSDGGWGEDNDSYAHPETAAQAHESTSFQTAWAMLALLAAGEGASSGAVRRGAEYILRTQRDDGLWHEDWFTAPGFPRVFYLKYHGYSKYFPLWALARYRSERSRHA